MHELHVIEVQGKFCRCLLIKERSNVPEASSHFIILAHIGFYNHFLTGEIIDDENWPA